VERFGAPTPGRLDRLFDPTGGRMAVTATVADQSLPKSVSPLVGHEDAFRKRLARLGWMFATPALVVVGAVTIFPIVFSVVMSFNNVNVLASGFKLEGFTFSNFKLVFESAEWRYALFFTVGYTIVTVFFELFFGTMIALVLERLIRGRGIMMAILLLPWSLITVLSAELWKYSATTPGIIDSIWNAIGLGTPTIIGGAAAPSIAILCIADIWKTTPFVSIIVLAGLVMLPQDIYEAADVDGATGWSTFWRITFPLLRPTIALAVLFRVLQAFGLFDLPFVLTGGGPGYKTTSLAILGYNVMFNQDRYGPGAAVATTTALLVVLGCLAFLKVFRAQVGEDR
jgi:multiple sugar transport system permease protein